MPFSFLHAADIHLDSPLRGLERYEGAPVEEIRNATRKALANLVQAALEHRVAFVLIAGDLYDGDWRDAGTGLFFVAQMKRLREAGIPVFLIAGNHDAENRMTQSLRLPENVRRFDSKRPQTQRLDALDVAVHGQSYAARDVFEDLAARYPAGERGPFHIGLLHTCGTAPSEHQAYAPCTLDGLRAKNYHYWALGHVHTAAELQRAGDAPVVFCGNLQGRHARETGPKGAVLVTVDDQHRITERRLLPLDVFRWDRCELDITAANNVDDLCQTFQLQAAALQARADGLPLALRVTVHGATALDQKLRANTHWQQELRAAADSGIWVEKIELQTRPERAQQSLGEGPWAELEQALQTLHFNPAALHTLLTEHDELAKRLPADVAEELSQTPPAQLLQDVQALLTARLLAGRQV